jgi:tRNA-specific adenosine deaminase 1
VMDVSGDEIAEVVLKEFEKWPTKRKPLLRGDGVKEWVPLSGIVAQGEAPEIGGQIIGLII